jgi:hypothetical protein
MTTSTLKMELLHDRLCTVTLPKGKRELRGHNSLEMTRRDLRVSFGVIAIIAAAALAELAMGRVPWCKCGYIKLWHGVVHSSENSQHISDWYTFTHIVHGICFYALLWLIAPRSAWDARLVVAVALEAGWEVLENTPMVINRYRAATIALDYYGDSVINSVADIVAMMSGFWMARRFPIVVTVLLFLGLEIGLLFIIRDNLTLNILMLIYPVEAVKRWQSGG